MLIQKTSFSVYAYVQHHVADYERRMQMKKWCWNNLRWYRLAEYGSYSEFTFISEKDAMRFKLVWG